MVGFSSEFEPKKKCPVRSSLRGRGGEKMKKGAWRGIRNEIVENMQRSVLGKVLGGTKEVDEMENLTWRGIRRERVKNHA